MSGWVVMSIVGGVFAVVVVVLLVVVSRAVTRTARNAGELMVALEQVQAQTRALADLEARSKRASMAAAQAATAMENGHQRDPVTDTGGGHDPGH